MSTKRLRVAVVVIMIIAIMIITTRRPLVGRKTELQSLRTELDRTEPSMVILIGRRRVGKTRLLVEVAGGRPAVYYQATKVADSMSLGLFKREAEHLVGTDPVLDSVSDWLGVFTFLEDVARSRLPGLTVMLDEFPYLCEANDALPSIVQKFVDGLRERRSHFNLVLCGSKISFMEELLGERNPLHGRQTLALDLNPLPFRDTARFFPEWPLEQRLIAYGVFGGMPYYLNLCDPSSTLAANVHALVLATGAPLADEPSHLLQSELRDVTRYATILRAVAEGCTRSSDILGRVRELRDASALAPYVRKLQELRLIRIVRSLDATERERDRRYYLDDPFLAFWYRFYLPNASALVAGHAPEVWKHAIEPYLDDYMGGLFERICRDYMLLFAQEVLDAPAQDVGQIWGKDFDMDVAGRLLNGASFSGECKWWRGRVGLNVLEGLREATAQTPYFEARSGEHFYLLFARSGWTGELEQRRAEDPSLRLLGAAELLGRD